MRRGLRWAWLAGALWLRLGRVRERAQPRAALAARPRAPALGGRAASGSHGEVARLDAQQRDPAARRALAEHALREKSGMARPGEIIYRIRPGEPGEALTDGRRARPERRSGARDARAASRSAPEQPG